MLLLCVFNPHCSLKWGFCDDCHLTLYNYYLFQYSPPPPLGKGSLLLYLIPTPCAFSHVVFLSTGCVRVPFGYIVWPYRLLRRGYTSFRGQNHRHVKSASLSLYICLPQLFHNFSPPEPALGCVSSTKQHFILAPIQQGNEGLCTLGSRSPQALQIEYSCCGAPLQVP